MYSTVNLLQVKMSESRGVRLGACQADWDNQYPVPIECRVVSQHCLHPRVEGQQVEGEPVDPQSQVDLNPLHQLQGEVSAGETQTLHTHSKVLLAPPHSILVWKP